MSIWEKETKCVKRTTQTPSNHDDDDDNDDDNHDDSDDNDDGCNNHDDGNHHDYDYSDNKRLLNMGVWNDWTFDILHCFWSSLILGVAKCATYK